MHQVVDVLLDNARRHGGRHVQLTIGSRSGFGLVQVSDDGPGIDPAHRERIFERGWSGGGGTGVGLAVARALVETYGGGLELTHDAPPVFELRLPLAPVGVGPDQAFA